MLRMSGHHCSVVVGRHTASVDSGQDSDTDCRCRPALRRVNWLPGVSAEWNSGSKKRVIKYYVVYAGLGLIVGAVIGIIIGLCVHFLS